MSEYFGVLLNGVAQLEYDRGRALTDYQLAYLDSMNAKMAAGIDLGGETVTAPDLAQRTQFVAANLLAAMRAGDEGLSSALCTWLAHHHPDLEQLKYTESEDGVAIELVYDEEYARQVAVRFDSLN